MFAGYVLLVGTGGGGGPRLSGLGAGDSNPALSFILLDGRGGGSRAAAGVSGRDGGHWPNISKTLPRGNWTGCDSSLGMAEGAGSSLRLGGGVFGGGCWS